MRAPKPEATSPPREEATKCSPEIKSEYKTEATRLVASSPHPYKGAGRLHRYFCGHYKRSTDISTHARRQRVVL